VPWESKNETFARQVNAIENVSLVGLNKISVFNLQSKKYHTYVKFRIKNKKIGCYLKR
jgi:hypothetical protein